MNRAESFLHNLPFSNQAFSRLLLRIGVTVSVNNGSVLVGCGIAVSATGSGSLFWLFVGIGLALFILSWLGWLSLTMSKQPSRTELIYRIGLCGWGVLGYVFGVARGIELQQLIR